MATMLPIAEFNALVAEVVLSLDQGRLNSRVINCGRDTAWITVPMPWPQLAQRVFKNAEQGEWLGDLINAILVDPETGASLTDACRRGLAAWDQARRAAEALAPAGRRGDALVLFNRAPFVDRANERPLLESVVQFAGRRVLVVRGEMSTGKTHLEQFARHLVEEQVGTNMATLRLEQIKGTDVDDKGGLMIGVMDLMEALVSRMNLPLDPTWDRLAQQQRQADKLVNWLVGQTQAFRANGVQWVIVIDSANHPKVGSGVLELIEHLIAAAAVGDLVNTCLIVLALPEGRVPLLVTNNVAEKALLPLSRTEVQMHIAALANALGRVATPEALEGMEAFVLDGLVFPLDRKGMDKLNELLVQLHDEVLKAA